ncbi:MAG TPA: VOC family protein [Balneolaceae bacterium]|nr:VOC family protein [Balneolaceae bacterium]
MKYFIATLLFLVSYTSTLYAQDQQTQLQTKSNHIAVSVTNLEESEEFYRDFLGLKQIDEPFNDGLHAWFDIGGTQLHLIESADERRERSINNHLCFSTADLESFVETLRSNNIEFRNWAGDPNEITLRPDGISQIYFKDPDGFWIEMNDDF